MYVLFLALVVVGRVSSMPVEMVATSKLGIDLSILTACERNIQVHCINQYGTFPYLRGSKGVRCNVKLLVDCFHAEKRKKECRVDDFDTVYYINAFLRNVDVTKCMDDFDYSEVQQLFQPPNPKNIHEISNTHRTFSSGDHGTDTYKSTDNEVDSDENHFGESGSGQP